MSDDEIKLILVRGLPGSGKSTFAKSRMRDGDVHLEADMWFYQDGCYSFDKSKLSEAHNWCLSQAKIALEKGQRVWVSNTFTTYRELQPYLELVEDLGLKSYVYVARGSFSNIHKVPEDVITQMKNRWEVFIGEQEIAFEY